MIRVVIKRNSIQMSGHAGRMNENGVDRACAAVSALTCSLVNSLRDLTGDRIQAELASGDARIRWEHLSAPGKLLVDSWFLGITDIDREYNCIQFQ